MEKDMGTLKKELEFCNEVMHDIEHKLEDAYLEENIREIKRCEQALRTLDKEFFDLRHEMNHLPH